MEELEMASQAQSSGGWAQLPDDLVDNISRRLPVLSAITMGRVCRPWQRIIAGGGRGLPWVLTAHSEDDLTRCFSILHKNYWDLQTPGASGNYCWGSVEDWLIIKTDATPDLQTYLWNPFSTAKIALPPFHDRYAKMVLSASPDDPNCLFLLVGSTSTDQSVACWTRGISTWRIMDDDKRLHSFADATFCDGHFYFVMQDYSIHTLDAQAVMLAIKQPQDVGGAVQLHFHRHQVSIPERPVWPSHPLRPYLVESCGELLMVCRLFRTRVSHIVTHGFEVFKLDVRRMVWSKMQGLGDRVLFLGTSDSRSFSAKDLGDGVANRIFFINSGLVSVGNERNHPPICDSTLQRPIKNCAFSDWGSFKMDTKCMDGACLVPNKNRSRLYAQSPIWLTAPLWWFFITAPLSWFGGQRTGQVEKSGDRGGSSSAQEKEEN